MDTLELANDYVNFEWEDFEAKHKDDTATRKCMKYLYRQQRTQSSCGRACRFPVTVKVQLRDGRTGESFDQPGYNRTHALPEAASPGRR